MAQRLLPSKPNSVKSLYKLYQYDVLSYYTLLTSIISIRKPVKITAAPFPFPTAFLLERIPTWFHYTVYTYLHYNNTFLPSYSFLSISIIFHFSLLKIPIISFNSSCSTQRNINTTPTNNSTFSSSSCSRFKGRNSLTQVKVCLTICNAYLSHKTTAMPKRMKSVRFHYGPLHRSNFFFCSLK